ncbi:MAG: LacI family transcriptional regulator [Spirochaetes bacterium]|nr:MAG: LacI family transcriptional regulator [Spirochaetota bacterium]
MLKIKKLKSIEDIAVACGVSISTVSRALNNEPGISSKTRQKILKMAQEQNFTPRTRKRPLVRSQLDLMVVVPEEEELSANPFFNVSELLGAINESFRTERKRVEIITAENFAHYIDVERPGCDGILFAYRGIEEALRKRLRDRKIPHVFLSRSFADDNYVSCNGIKGVLQLVEHLLATGHRRIGYFGNEGNPNNADRLRGYRLALAESGTALPADLVFMNRGALDSCRPAAEFFAAKKCDAVACFNDFQAVTLINELAALGKRVPADVSVTGFDDSPLSRVSRPPVTTIALPTFEMAFLASRWLRDNILNRLDRSLRIEVDGTMVVRKSVRRK